MKPRHWALKFERLFRKLLADLKELHAQSTQYPFLSALEEPITVLQELAGKNTRYYFQNCPSGNKTAGYERKHH